MAAREPKQERSRRAAERILEAAAEGFAENGYERTSIRRIAERSEVPLGSIYQYFEDKTDLLRTLVEQYSVALERIFASKPDEEAGDSPKTDGDELTKIVTTITAALIDLATNQPAFRTMFAGPSSAGPFADAGASLRGAFADSIRAALDVAIADNAQLNGIAAVVCTEITRGLLPRTVDEYGTIDRQYQAELDRALVAYLRQVKQPN